MRHIPIKCPTCATTYRVGVGNDEDVSVEMDLRIRAQEGLEQERTARQAAEERAERAELENRELRGVVEENAVALLQAESLCKRIEAEGGHGQRVHEMARGFLSLPTATPYQCPVCETNGESNA